MQFLYCNSKKEERHSQQPTSSPPVVFAFSQSSKTSGLECTLTSILIGCFMMLNPQNDTSVSGYPLYPRVRSLMGRPASRAAQLSSYSFSLWSGFSAEPICEFAHWPLPVAASFFSLINVSLMKKSGEWKPARAPQVLTCS